MSNSLVFEETPIHRPIVIPQQVKVKGMIGLPGGGLWKIFPFAA